MLSAAMFREDPCNQWCLLLCQEGGLTYGRACPAACRMSQGTKPMREGPVQHRGGCHEARMARINPRLGEIFSVLQPASCCMRKETLLRSALNLDSKRHKSNNCPACENQRPRMPPPLCRDGGWEERYMEAAMRKASRTGISSGVVASGGGETRGSGILGQTANALLEDYMEAGRGVHA